MRPKARPITTIRPAEIRKTARQPIAAETNRAAGRASMMPVRTPAMTLPTTRPRRAGGTRWARQRQQNLGARRTQSHCERSDQEGARAGGRRSTDEPHRGEAQCDQNETFVLQEVGQGDKKEQADSVADLGHADDRPREVAADADVASDLGDKGLGVIQVRDQASRRQRQDLRRAVEGSPEDSPFVSGR